MHIKASVLAWAGLELATVATAQNNTSQCHDYVILSTRGTFEVQGPSIGFPNMIAWTLGNVTGSVERDTVYPAAKNQTYYFGANDIVSYIDSSLESCPNQKYAVLGYSQGASASGAALHNYTDPNSAGYKAIKAVLVIGNPYKIPNEDSDVSQDGSTSNRGFRGVLYNETGPDAYGNGIPDIYYSDGKLLDICYDKDPVCAPGMQNTNISAHVQYGVSESVQEMGAKFLISKLTATNTTSNSTDPTTSSGASGNSSTGSATGTSTTAASSSTTSKSGSVISIQLPTSMFAMVLALMTGVVAM